MIEQSFTCWDYDSHQGKEGFLVITCARCLSNLEETVKDLKQRVKDLEDTVDDPWHGLEMRVKDLENE